MIIPVENLRSVPRYVVNLPPLIIKDLSHDIDVNGTQTDVTVNVPLAARLRITTY